MARAMACVSRVLEIVHAARLRTSGVAEQEHFPPQVLPGCAGPDDQFRTHTSYMFEQARAFKAGMRQRTQQRGGQGFCWLQVQVVFALQVQLVKHRAPQLHMHAPAPLVQGPALWQHLARLTHALNLACMYMCMCVTACRHLPASPCNKSSQEEGITLGIANTFFGASPVRHTQLHCNCFHACAAKYTLRAHSEQCGHDQAHQLQHQHLARNSARE